MRLPKGVTELTRPRGGRKFRAEIRDKGVPIHLGLYETTSLAAFAFNVAAEAVGRGAKPPNAIPHDEAPSAEVVREITLRVRRRLGKEKADRHGTYVRPSVEALLTFFEITVIGFWRSQAATDSGDAPGRSLDAAAGRLVEAASLLFWDVSSGLPAPDRAMTDLLARRIDAEFRQPDLTREILDDDSDDLWRVARWLAYPERLPTGRGFREEVQYLYREFLAEESEAPADWAAILGLTPPYRVDQVRDAYRRLSKHAHPDAGGSPADFVRLNTAYESALAYVRLREGGNGAGSSD